MSTETNQPAAITGLMAQLPHGEYTEYFQPTYADRQALAHAMQELTVTQGVTTPEDIDRLQSQLTAVANGDVQHPIIILGRCAEPVDIHQPIQELVDSAVMSHDIALSALPQAIVIQRNRGQNTKPRSSEFETLPSGEKILSYMGDAVNDIDPNNRAADPSRMVAAAVQARDLETGLSAHLGEHIPAAHEALLLPYELPFVREVGGDKYLLSADLPWIGVRTNQADGPHIELLSGIANPVGVKIGPNSTEEHIASLKARLNPEGIPGRMVLMIRAGYEQAALRGIVRATAHHAPESILLYDVHGVTKSHADGTKVRAVSDIQQQIHDLAVACEDEGLRLHGTHLETTTDNNRLECVDDPSQCPTHPGGVDPQLNPRQTTEVLKSMLTI